MNISKYVGFITIGFIDVSCKVCVGVETTNQSQHLQTSTQHNKNMTTSHFDKISHILINHRLPSSCAYGQISILARCLQLIWLQMNHIDWVRWGTNHPPTQIGLLGKFMFYVGHTIHQWPTTMSINVSHMNISSNTFSHKRILMGIIANRVFNLVFNWF